MKITIVCAGKLKEKYLTAGIAEYQKRLTPFTQFEIREIHEEKMPDAPSDAEKQQVLGRAGERLLKQVPDGSYLYVLDVYGEEKSSEELSAELGRLMTQGRSSITFLIGGAFGLSEAVRRTRWCACCSRSRFTAHLRSCAGRSIIGEDVAFF